MSLGFAEAFLRPAALHHGCDSVAVGVHADPHHLSFVDDVGHVSVDEVAVLFAAFIAHHEYLGLFEDYAHLFVVVLHVEVRGLLQAAVVKIENLLVSRVPDGQQPRHKQQNVGEQKENITPADKYDGGHLEENALALNIHTLISKQNPPIGLGNGRPIP
jgi:hypothetical protein